jgi:hypothetical protein
MSEHESRSRLDTAIDRAARRMMDADPRPGLRHRVLARLGSPAAATAWWPRLGLAAATMAIIAVAVVYMTSGQQRPPTQPADVVAEAPLPVLPPPALVPETPAAAAPRQQDPAEQATTTGRTPRVEYLPDPPRVDDVFGSRPDGRVAAATVDTPTAAGRAAPEPLADIEPLQVPALAGTLAMEAREATDPQDAPDQAKPAAAPPAPVNIRVDVTLTEEGEGALPAKTVSMLVASHELGRVRSGGSGIVLNVDARPSILPDGRVRVMLTLEYSPGGLAQMSQSLTTVLVNGKPQIVSQSADPKSTRRVQAEVTATIVK